MAGSDRRNERSHAISVLCSNREAAGMLWNRVQTKGRFSNNRKRAVASCHQLTKVIAGNVFYNLSTALRDCAISEDQCHADNKIAEASVSVAQRSGVIGGEDPTHSRLIQKQRI